MSNIEDIMDAPSSPAYAASEEAANGLDGEIEPLQLTTPISTAPATPTSSVPPSSLSAVNSRKRPTEDTEQFVVNISRRIKLRGCDQEELRKFSKLTDAEQSVWLAAHVLQAIVASDTVPYDAIYEIPKRTEAYIDMQVFRILTDPSLPRYHGTNGPVKLLTEKVVDNPSQGVTQAVKDDKSKWDVILRRMRERLTDRRYDIKALIVSSIGPDPRPDDAPHRPDAMNIMVLCENLAAIYRPSEIVIDIALCARVAFLRQMAREYPNDPKYWSKVDAKLDSIRKLSNQDSKVISKKFAKILEYDRGIYGVHAPLETAGSSTVTARTRSACQ
ncbi:hypothetical protein PLICRDRAFT_684816 [Plicaturopsis crispa FD-325 SS-3]|uniref:Uncharacterized protein n=1 Tax=Plicaturopsis crispa FD-325 SS-3 TaxID=944288 RepID=A0A0C9T431_PLICR|nr:hypothetical protein PLICRDRAFT_684816 [Plicaturopsis crispa FD-325 SS-3]